MTIRKATASTVWSLFESVARGYPKRVAVSDQERRVTYGALADRARSLAGALVARDFQIGDRIAVVSENRIECLEVLLAAAKIGAVVACPSWRLAPPEMAHCLALAEPKIAFGSQRHAHKIESAAVVIFGPDYEAFLRDAAPAPDRDVDPEDPLVILYTSGTTGLPKGAVLSHRAQIVRNLVTRAEFGIGPTDAFVAWSPLYHMGAVDNSLGTLMTGGEVIVVDGFDSARLREIVATRALGWLLLMPGMVGRFADELRAEGTRPVGVKLCGVMADLVPRAEIAAITELLQAPYANTFGATETGCPPCSSNLIPIGEVPASLAKEVSPFCETRLVDADDNDVPDGTPGELAMRGPTLFSGYWRAPDTNANDFRNGWFHMGDVFIRHPDGKLSFVDRVKYLIKTGGENVYPAEIERVLLAHPHVADAAVVRRSDPKWGEVPIAFVAKKDGAPPDLEAELYAQCRAALAGFKQPKGIVFIPFEDFPRSASGKVQRHELEKRT